MTRTATSISLDDLVEKTQVMDIDFSHQEYLTTEEAVVYMRKSTSWLLRRGDIPFLSGRPNIYAKRDLDEWFDRNKHIPRV